jgi:hypothetical protein
MPLASITRLRVRSWRLVPPLLWRAFWAQRQARAADGCLGSDVRTQAGGVFWTRTLWRDETTMRAYIGSGAHRPALSKLQHWCDEASLVHWEQDATTLPEWSEAETRLRASGRTSRVRHQSPAHARGETLPTT